MSVDHRRSQTSVRDQGARGTCVAFAVTAAHEWLRGISTELSEESAILAAKAAGCTLASEATTVNYALMGLTSVGQCSLSAWPYGKPQYPSRPTNWNILGKLSLGKWSSVSNGFVGIASELDRGRPVVATVHFVPDAWIAASDNGLVRDISGAKVTAHAVLAVGHDNIGRQEGTEQVLIFKNSWGQWGDDGYGYLTRSYVDRHLVCAHSLETIA